MTKTPRVKAGFRTIQRLERERDRKRERVETSSHCDSLRFYLSLYVFYAGNYPEDKKEGKKIRAFSHFDPFFFFARIYLYIYILYFTHEVCNTEQRLEKNELFLKFKR